MIELAQPTPSFEVRIVAERQAQRFIAGGLRRGRPVVAGAIEDSLLYPVYAVDPRQPLKEGEISGLSPVGWRMVLLTGDGEAVASSDVRDGPTNPTPSGFVAGSPSLRQLVHELREMQAGSELYGRYEPRFFEAPSLQVRSLWLHGARDVFMVAGAKAASLANEQAMVGIVNTVFARKASSRDPDLYPEYAPTAGG
jgi:hypothetical protein